MLRYLLPKYYPFSFKAFSTDSDVSKVTCA